jgi:thiopeptide-type bacteriocin biosynthesis protein
MSPASAGWLSYHLHLRAPHESFLAGHLAPWLEHQVDARRIRRFFFIRYGKDGGHLRVRLLPHPGAEPGMLRAGLEAAVRGHLERSPEAAAGPWLEEQPYSRALHYFGENGASVYAELMNEATSWLCLRIVRGPGGDRWVCRWLVLISTLHQLVRGASQGDDDFALMVDEGRSFARQGWESLGFSSIVDDAQLADQPLLLAAASTALARGAAAANDPQVRRMVRLLRRTRRYVPNGGHVATHALHLLCNKLGFSFYEEYNLFTALRRLACTSAAPRAGQFIAGEAV